MIVLAALLQALSVFLTVLNLKTRPPDIRQEPRPRFAILKQELYRIFD